MPSNKLSRQQQKEIKKIVKGEALKVVKRQSETKTTTFPQENIQLYHSQPYFHTNMLYTTHGSDSGDRPGNWTVREGDELYLQNLSLRLHLFNKQDRPNVHYRVMVYWYESGTVPNTLDVLDAQNNLLLNRPNREAISVVMDKIIPCVYPGPQGREFSKMVRLSKSWKNKKIIYNDANNVNSPYPKLKDLGFMVLAYDSFGTLITDNIASIAYQYDVRFKEN